MWLNDNGKHGFKILALMCCSAVCVVNLSGCAKVKAKASDHYLAKAKKVAALQAPGREEIDGAFEALAKSLEYAPSSKQAIQTLEVLTDLANKAGFSDAPDVKLKILNAAIEKMPDNWSAYAAAINTLSVRGDVLAMNELGAKLEALIAVNMTQAYEATLVAALCYASIAPWLESQGQVNLNKNPEMVVEKAKEYVRVLGKTKSLRESISKMEAAAGGPELKKRAPQELIFSLEVALADMLKDQDKIDVAEAFVAKIDADPAFAKAVEAVVNGNAALINKDYASARAFYQSALRNFPAFLDARKQLLEVDFQEGATPAMADTSMRMARKLLYGAYKEATAIVEDAKTERRWLPFMTKDKFLSDVYALLAADLMAIKTLDKRNRINKTKLEAEFKAALDEAIKLNPQGSLPRELQERYDKEGF